MRLECWQIDYTKRYIAIFENKKKMLWVPRRFDYEASREMSSVPLRRGRRSQKGSS